MAQQLINIGNAANDGSGDPLRTAGDKINDNFTEIYGGKLDLAFWNGTNPFPQPIVPTLYILTADHGVSGDPDFIPQGTWMIGPAGATAFGDFYPNT